MKTSQVKIAILKRLVPEKKIIVLVVHLKQTWEKLGKKVENFFSKLIFFSKISLFCDFINKNPKSPKRATISCWGGFQPGEIFAARRGQKEPHGRFPAPSGNTGRK